MEMLSKHKITLFSLFAIFLTTQISFFIVFIFEKTMLIEFLNYDSHIAGKFNLLTVISYMFATIFFGYLSDKINKRYLIIVGAFGIFLAIYPLIVALKAGTPTVILGFSLLMGALIGMTEGTLNPLTAEAFPINIRATSVAFCWNFTAVAFGGSAPIIAMWLIRNVGDITVVAYYLMIACFITITVTLAVLWRTKIAGQNAIYLNPEVKPVLVQ
jgi:MHS family proline/betaine transporter-like MFS transporter